MEDSLFQVIGAVYAGFPKSLVANCLMIVAFGLVGICFYFLFVPGRRLSPLAAFGYVFRRGAFHHRSSRVDILHFFVTLGLWIPVIGALVAALFSTDIAALLDGKFGKQPALMYDPAAALAQFAVILVCKDFGSYLGHYVLHKVPALWSIHRAHHSAEVLTFLTSVRTHPLEYLHMQCFIAAFGGLGGGLFLHFTGTTLHAAPIILLTATVAFTGIFGLAQHSHIPISFGKISYFLVSPVMHQVHHSAELRHRDRNFSTQLAIFDWLFGTIYIPQPGEKYRLGLNSEEIGENNPHIRLRDFYLEPVVYAWRLLRR